MTKADRTASAGKAGALSAAPAKARAGGRPKAAASPERPPQRAVHPRTPRRQRQIEAKRSAILDAALQLFSRLGLHGSTVEQIAEAADVSKTNLFYYFASKEAIYLAVLQRLLDEWLAPFKELSVEADPVASIGDYIRRKVVFSRTNPEASRLFCQEMVRGAPLLGPQLRGAVKELVDAKAGVIAAWIEAGRLAPVDPYHLIFSIWSITQHYADFAVQVKALVGRDLEDDAFLEETVANVQQLILEGIRPRPAAKR